MKNTNELRKILSKTLKDVSKGSCDTKVAASIVAISNSMLKSASLELQHSKHTKNEKEIDFLKTI